MMTNFNDANPIVKAYSLLIRIGGHLRSAVLLIIRLAWGLELIVSGHSHLADVPTMVERFKSWGVPMPTFNVYVSGYTEMIGGALLILGLASRAIAIPLVFNFIVAFLTASRENVGAIFTAPFTVETWTNIIDDAAFPFLIANLVILAFGPGKASVDYFIQRVVLKRRYAVKPSDGVVVV